LNKLKAALKDRLLCNRETLAQSSSIGKTGKRDLKYIFFHLTDDLKFLARVVLTPKMWFINVKLRHIFRRVYFTLLPIVSVVIVAEISNLTQLTSETSVIVNFYKLLIWLMWKREVSIGMWTSTLKICN